MTTTMESDSRSRAIFNISKELKVYSAAIGSTGMSVVYKYFDPPLYFDQGEGPFVKCGETFKRMEKKP